MGLFNAIFGSPEPERETAGWVDQQLGTAAQRMATAQQALGAPYGMGNSNQLLNMYSGYQSMANAAAGMASTTAPARPLRDLAEGDLDHPAGKATLEELANFWAARWQHQWVMRSEIDDDFYTIAAVRLRNARRLEVHMLSNGKTVYRLIEK